VLEITCTNTVPIRPDKRVPKLTVLSVAPALAEAMRRIHNGESVSDLFQPDWPTPALPDRADRPLDAVGKSCQFRVVRKEIPQADIDRCSIASDAPVGRLRRLGPTVRLSEIPSRWARVPRSRSATASPPGPPARRPDRASRAPRERRIELRCRVCRLPQCLGGHRCAVLIEDRARLGGPVSRPLQPPHQLRAAAGVDHWVAEAEFRPIYRPST
jgi:Phosphoribosyl synthetase-associated domain